MDLKLDFEKRDFARTLQGWAIPITGAEEIAQRIRLRLCIRRGSFPLDAASMNAAAREMIEEALAPMAGVRLTEVSCRYDPEEDRARVDCRFVWNGQDIEVKTEV